MNNTKNIKKRKGSIDLAIVMWIFMILMVLLLNFLPVFVIKMELGNFADEIVRVAEIEGEVGSATNERIEKMIVQTGLNPTINWSKTGTIEINETIECELSYETDIGFYGVGSYPVTLWAKASGRGERYWK